MKGGTEMKKPMVFIDRLVILSLIGTILFTLLNYFILYLTEFPLYSTTVAEYMEDDLSKVLGALIIYGILYFLVFKCIKNHLFIEIFCWFNLILSLSFIVLSSIYFVVFIMYIATLQFYVLPVWGCVVLLFCSSIYHLEQFQVKRKEQRLKSKANN